MSERPLDNFSLTSDFDSAEDEAEIAIWFLFRDLVRLRAHIRDIWSQYGDGAISLISASCVTSQAVEIVKEMEADLFAEFGSRFHRGSDYLDIMAAMLGMDRRQEISDLVIALDGQPEPLSQFTISVTWVALWKFGDRIRPGKAYFPKPGFFGYFDPNADRSKMTAEERKAEDFCLLLNQLPDVHLQAVLSGSGRDSKQSTGTTVDEPALVRDLRCFIDDPKHPIPVHLVFQWDLWKDIVLVNRTCLATPLRELHSVAENIVSSVQSWLATYDDRYHTANDVTPLRREMQEQVANIKRKVLGDVLGDYKRGDSPNAPVTPFSLFLYNPWACGVAIYTCLFNVHHSVVQIINGSGYFSATLQLYNALLQHQKIESWPLMDRFLRICQSTIYKGFPPRIGTFSTAFFVSAGSDPATMQGPGRRTPGFTSTGHGTGAFPMELGGCLLARIAEKQKYKLTDDIIAELFPHHSDEVIRASVRRTHTSPRFGGKRCDPFSLLTALRDRAEADQAETALSIDLFAAQRISLAILQRWHSRTSSLFAECFSETYQERNTQLFFLVGHIFTAMEKPPRPMNPATVSKIFDEAARAMREGREDVDSGLQQGAKIKYF